MAGAVRDPAGEVISGVLRRWLPRLLPLIALSALVTCAVRPLWRHHDPSLAAYVAVLEAVRSGSEVDPWGEPWSPPSAREELFPRGWISLGPNRCSDHSSNTSDDVWVGDLAQRDDAAREMERRLPAAYREVWKFPWLGWKLTLGLLLADALLRRAARSRLERAGLLVLAGAGTAAITLILSSTLAEGLVHPGALAEVPGPFRPQPLPSALLLGGLAALVLWLRAREGETDAGANGSGPGSTDPEPEPPTVRPPGA